MYDHERSLVESMNGRPFVLLGVNSDEKKSRVRKAVRENNLNWRSWWDGSGGPIAKKFKIRGWPTIFLIDHNGVIQFKNVRGGNLDVAIEKLVSVAESEGATGEAPEEFREFTDNTGKFKVMAHLVKFEDGSVTLKKEDGSEIVVPYKRLSDDDREWVRLERHRRRRMGNL